MSRQVLRIHTVLYLNGERLQSTRDFGTLDEARTGMSTLFDQLSPVENHLGEVSEPSRFRRLLGKFL